MNYSEYEKIENYTVSINYMDNINHIDNKESIMTEVQKANQIF